MKRTHCEGTHFALRACLGTCVVFAGLVAGQPDAQALQGGEDPALLPVLVDKRYGGENRHQLSAMFATSMVTKYTEGIGGYLSYQYNFIDMLGVEVGGGFFNTSETSIMQEIRATNGEDPVLEDQFALQWTAMANIVFVPIYGKMSFASEFDPAFDLYLLAGGGVVGTRRGIGFGGDGTPASFESKTTWGVDVGGGFRFYFTRLIALRLEFRNWFYPDPSTAQTPATQQDIGGVTSVLNFQAGLQFSFGGDS